MSEKKVFETKVVNVGERAASMQKEANMIILFGLDAPIDLAEYCYEIDNNKLQGPIYSGGSLVIDEQEFPITAVGDVVERNLSHLGHITISLDGNTEKTLPGTLHVKVDETLRIDEGSVIKILV